MLQVQRGRVDREVRPRRARVRSVMNQNATLVNTSEGRSIVLGNTQQYMYRNRWPKRDIVSIGVDTSGVEMAKGKGE